MRLRQLPLRSLLLLSLSGSLLLLVLISLFHSYWSGLDDLARERRQAALRELEELTRHADLADDSRVHLMTEIAYRSMNPEVLVLAVVDGEGRVLLANRAEWIGAQARAALPEFAAQEAAGRLEKPAPGQHLDRQRWRLAAWSPLQLPPGAGNLRSDAATAFIVFDLEATRVELFHRLLDRELFILALVAFVLFLLYLGLTRLFVRPLQRMAEVLHSFDPGGGTQLPLEGAAEVVTVAGAFNAMSRDLSATWRAMPDLLFEMDEEGRYQRVAARHDDLLLAPAESLQGRTVHDLMPATTADAVMAALRDAGRTGHVLEREITLDVPAGRRWFEISAARKEMGKGQPPRFIVLSRDITARKQAESQREEMRLRLEKIADRLPGMVYQFRLRPDGSSCFPFASAAIREIYRVAPEEVREDAAKVFAVLHPADFDAIVESIQRSAREMTAWRHEYRVRFHDGTVEWRLGNAMPEKEADGSVLWHGFITDVTVRRRMEERAHLTERVFDSSREGMTLTDPRGRILVVNRAFTEITGYTLNEVVGKTPSVLASGRHDRDFYSSMWSALERDGHWEGEIWNKRKDGRLLPEWLSISAIRDAKGELINYLGVFSDLSRLKESEARVEELAWRQRLTGKPNRAFLLARLGEVLAGGGGCAVVLVNLRGFQRVNASHGLSAGDLVLREAVARIEGAATGHLVCHLDGDEFAVFYEANPGEQALARLAQELLDVLGRPYALGEGSSVHLGAAVGIALAPEHGRTVPIVMQQADAALKAARREEGSSYRFASEELTTEARRRLETENRLRRAVADGQLRLHYQPQVDVRHGRLIGAEALLRWEDPTSGLVPPGEFIPLAEESGLIVELGQWALEEACRQGAAWLAAGRPPLQLAVNVAARQLQVGGFVETVRGTLARTGFPARLLELELTESALMAAQESLLRELAALRQLGVGLSIDDFGTGYSSLAYLQQFPVGKLKIDKRFVDHLAEREEDRRIVAAVVSLGHALKLDVLAEGVERRDQLEWLERLGCDSWQGYLKSRPLPAGEFAALFEAGEQP